MVFKSERPTNAEGSIVATSLNERDWNIDYIEVVKRIGSFDNNMHYGLP